MADRDAIKVWDRILQYQNHKGWEIYQAYNYNDAAITDKLMSYSGRTKYHGHGFGDSTQGTAGEAKTNQDIAITFLKNNAPTSTPSSGGSRNTVLARQGKKLSEKLYAIVAAGAASGQGKTIILGALKTANDNTDVTNKNILEELDRALARYKEEKRKIRLG